MKKPTYEELEKKLSSLEKEFDEYRRLMPEQKGNEIPGEVRQVRLPSTTQPHVRGSVIDISERKQAEDKLKRARNQLKQSEQLYRSLFENALVGMWRTRISDGKILKANDAGARLMGYPNAEALIAAGVVISEYYDPAHRQKLVDELMTNGYVHDFEGHWTYPDGHEQDVSISAQIYPEEGYIEGVIINITERVQTEGALRESEAKFRGLVESSSDWIWEVNAEGFYTYTSPQVESILGYRPDEIIGKTPFDLMPPEETKRIGEIFKDSLETGKPIVAVENINLHKDGRRVVLETSGIPFFDEEEKVAGYRGMDRDITERKQAEKALQESETLYRLFTQMTSDYVIALRVEADNTITVEWVVGSYLEMLGRTPQQGQPLSTEYTHPDDRDRVRQDIKRTLQNEATITEHRKYKADDSLIWIRVTRHPVWDETEQRVIRFYSAVQDITERKRAEEALRQREIRYRQMFETNQAIKLMIDPADGRIIEANEAAYRFYGYDAQILTSLRIGDINTLSDEEIRQEMAQVKSENRFFFNFRHRLASGEIRDVEVYSGPVQSDDETLLYSIIHDVTERKQAEQALRESEEKYSNLFHRSNDAILIHDLDGNILDVNRKMLDLFGYTKREISSITVPMLHPAQALGKSKWAFETIIRKNFVRLEIEFKKKSGELFSADISSSLFEIGSKKVIQGIVRDITDRKKMQEMMVQSEKMLSVGGLAAGMAHEINNPLAGMMQTAENVRNRLTNVGLPANLKAADEAGTSMEAIQTFMESRGIPRMLAAINESGRRVAGIVNNMLSFSRRSDAPASSHDFARLLDSSLELAATDYDLKKQYDFKTIEIVKEYEEVLPWVPCEGVKIQQVFLNILRNGAQAMQGEKNEGRRQKDGRKKPRFVLRLAHEDEAGMLRIEIEDNGPGMDAATRKRVFEPFFTTKPVGEGTGLGLSVSYFIITENHGGELDVESEPGKGTNFIIRLPVERGGR